MDNIKAEIEKQCNERHGNITKTIEKVCERLDNHSGRIKDLERFQSGVTVEIKNLCDKIDDLVTTIKWASGVTFATLIGFFIWYIQRL